MATVSAEHIANGIMGSVVTKWLSMPQDSDGGYVTIANHSDKTVQIYGVFGGCSVVIEGSNDPLVESDINNSTWWTLKNWDGEAMTKTAAGGWVILDNPIYVRAKTTGGDGTTSVNVVLCSKRG